MAATAAAPRLRFFFEPGTLRNASLCVAFGNGFAGSLTRYVSPKGKTLGYRWGFFKIAGGFYRGGRVNSLANASAGLRAAAWEAGYGRVPAAA